MANLKQSNRRLFASWAALVAITVAYFWIDKTANEHGERIASTAVTVTAIGLALIKVRVIMREFMEVRGDARLLARLANGLVVVMAAALLTAYFIGRALA